MFGWFDVKQKAYRNIPVDEQVECISLLGDIGLVKGRPALHVHGCVGHPDGFVRGGHLLHATVFPTLELFVTESAVPLEKREDAQTTLEFFAL
jgi:predicted DNA-binding protein with PD1-like motif